MRAHVKSGPFASFYEAPGLDARRTRSKYYSQQIRKYRKSCGHVSSRANFGESKCRQIESNVRCNNDESLGISIVPPSFFIVLSAHLPIGRHRIPSFIGLLAILVNDLDGMAFWPATCNTMSTETHMNELAQFPIRQEDSGPMSTADLLRIYDAALEANSALDGAYYENLNPTTAERATYYRRTERMTCLRERLYAALQVSRERPPANPGCQAKIRHDLNNQLLIILGYAELLSTPSLDEHTLTGLDQIRTASIKMTQIIKLQLS